MKTITVSIRCYAELNDSLPEERRYSSFNFTVPAGCSINKLLELLQIPSHIIDLVLVNGFSAHLEYILKENDRIALYPIFETFNISSVTKIRNKPLREPKFILDVHLGKLAHLLRMMGFDTIYENNLTDNTLIDISINDRRVLLSKDKELVENKLLTHALLVKNKIPRLQLIEIMDKLDLYDLINPFTRCIECNCLLIRVEKASVIERIPASVQNWCNEFYMCKNCDRIYWKGSHYAHMNSFIEEILSAKNNK